MPKNILYLVIWRSGHEEKIYVEHWLEFVEILSRYVERLGIPNLIYRKE